MKLLVLADLHDDFWADCGRNPFADVESLIADVDHLLLSGDLSNKPKVCWKYAFESSVRAFTAQPRVGLSWKS